MSDTTVAVNYKVVAAQCTTMESLSTKATTLKGDLDGLKSALSSNWVGGDADTLLNNYDEFVNNIETITADITAVKEWCEDTTKLFQSTSSTNSSNLAAAMSGK